MQRIEMIGASGVGKTTLYEKLNLLPENRRQFITMAEAYKSAALHADIPLKRFAIYCYQKILKSGLLKVKERGLSKVILLEHSKKLKGQRSKYNQVSVSFDILYDFLKNEPGPYYVEKRMSRFLRTVDDYLLLNNLLPVDDLILVDEGMTTHHFPGITDYGFQTYTTDQLKSDPVFTPAGIIHCVQKADVIFDQAMKRREEGVKTFSHGRLNEQELRAHIEKNILKDIKKVKSLQKIGTPVVEINTGEDFEIIVKKINKFAVSLDPG